MAMSGRERQAAFQERRRQAAEALRIARGRIEELEARVLALERERDRYQALVGYAMKREGWAEAERCAKEAVVSDSEDVPPTASEAVGRRAAAPPPAAPGPAWGTAPAPTTAPIPPFLVPRPC